MYEYRRWWKKLFWTFPSLGNFAVPGRIPGAWNTGIIIISLNLISLIFSPKPLTAHGQRVERKGKEGLITTVRGRRCPSRKSRQGVHSTISTLTEQASKQVSQSATGRAKVPFLPEHNSTSSYTTQQTLPNHTVSRTDQASFSKIPPSPSPPPPPRPSRSKLACSYPDQNDHKNNK